ncbi:MAG: GMC family oxidoreductase [Hyphomicrobiaceae bacterium]
MLIDARSLPDDLIEADVCVVGAGPAGISLARELAGKDVRVALLESGGVEFDAATQALADGDTFGDPLISPYIANHRQFGGNANVWIIKMANGKFGIRYVPFDEIDFEKRDWVPHSGWPFDRAHLIPYYERAQDVCGCGPYAYDAADWEGDDRQRFPVTGDDLETGIFQFGPGDVFHTKYREELLDAGNVKIFSHANAVEIVAKETGRTADRVRVRCLGGKQFSVTAKTFVLACGGFENARLLLMSNKKQSAGLGNEHDVVGRYYHDHPQAFSGHFTPTERQLFNKASLYDLRSIRGSSIQGFLRLSKSALEREQLLGVDVMLFPRPNARQTQAVSSFKNLMESTARKFKAPARASLPQGRLRDALPGYLRDIVRDPMAIAKAAYLSQTQDQPFLPNVGSGGWSKMADNSARFERFETMHLIEQSPDPDNRVQLGADRDALDCQRLEVHWRWHRRDAESYTRSLKVISRELRRAGLGEYHVDQDDGGLSEIVRPTGSHHLMGTTRMHDDPRQGVVDSDCRVHGMSNLYLAGSSTFPTGGYTNPTLTIVAMSIRLADLIKSEFQ